MRRAVIRRGFSLVEIVMALALGGIVAAALAGVLRRQQRFFAAATSLVAQRVSLRDATGILPAELRTLAPASGDVLAFSDSSLEIRATIGAAIVCDTTADGSGIALAPGTDLGGALSAFATAPQPGDIALVYDAGASDAVTDDRWVALDVSTAAADSDLCATSPFGTAHGPVVASAGTTSSVSLRFSSDARVPPTVHAGAFVRVLRRVRYRFYRASTGEWFLGYSEWEGSAFGVVQPVSGPFAPYSDAATSGLSLRYFDDAGIRITPGMDATRIARVEVVARGTTRSGLSASAMASPDSQRVAVRPRNP
jgi:prepilin-type N-terminal cleavage/methylation domain-containing protein